MASKKKTASKQGPKKSATPGNPDNSGKKEKKEKIEHPLIGNEDSKVYPFSETPPDFDSSLHKPLKKTDYAMEDVYFDTRADSFEAKAKEFRARAEEARTLGSGKERAMAKRFKKMMKSTGDLRQKLEAQGIDVDSLLAAQAEEDDS